MFKISLTSKYWQKKDKKFDINTNNERVYLQSIRSITLKATVPNQFDYRTDYDGPIFTVDLFQKLRCKKTKLAFIELTSYVMMVCTYPGKSI